MTITLITTSGLVSGIAHTFAAVGDELYVAQGVTWGSSNNLIFSSSHDDITATFAGDVIADGAGLSSNGVNTVIRILATGSLTTYAESGGSAAIFMNGNESSVINDGAISSSQSTGVVIRGDSQIINRGSIDAASGVFMGVFGSSGDSLVNSGQISANSSDDGTRNSRFNNGVYSEGGNTVIVNLAGGIISALGSEGAGVRLGEEANGSSVENHGEIVSFNYYGVSFDSLFADNTGALFNAGVITGDAGSFRGAAQADTVTNQGQMNGNVELRGGDDLFDGRGGIVNGAVLGGGGDDTYMIDDASITLIEGADKGTDQVKAKVSFTLGDNFEDLTLIGSGNFTGIGNTESNTLTGNQGANSLRGKGASDVLNGGDGNDKLFGGGSGDTLNGGADDDVLRGGKGNDTLNGGGENDVLIGGVGKDDLTGGAGEDVFRFVKANHSLNNGDADSILDFESGEDLIDLGAFAGKLNFIGSSALSGDAEVRVTEAGGNSTVRVDVDGDGTADMKIKLLGVTGLDAADFLL